MAYFFPLHGKNGQLHGIYMALHEKQAITWQNHVTWQKWELCISIRKPRGSEKILDFGQLKVALLH